MNNALVEQGGGSAFKIYSSSPPLPSQPVLLAEIKARLGMFSFIVNVFSGFFAGSGLNAETQPDAK